MANEIFKRLTQKLETFETYCTVEKSEIKIRVNLSLHRFLEMILKNILINLKNYSSQNNFKKHKYLF